MILVGGGSVLVDVTKSLLGASVVVKPEHFEVYAVERTISCVRQAHGCFYHTFKTVLLEKHACGIT